MAAPGRFEPDDAETGVTGVIGYPLNRSFEGIVHLSHA
jgi:hypothetical protein